MDNAVALVRAYLQLNGYFTITEYPVLRREEGSIRTLTEVDVAAFHLPYGEPDYAPDPALHVPHDRADMIIGEVKEGGARLNAGARDPVVLRAALVRFGCCTAEEADRVVSGLLNQGHAMTRAGHRIRLVVFGSTLEEGGAQRFHFVPLGQVVRWLQGHMAEHWELIRHSQTKDSVLSFLLTMEKARRGTSRSRGVEQ